MLLIGVFLGLLAALFQSLSYIASGCYVRRTGRPGWTLGAPQRVLTLLPYGLLAAFLWPPSFQGEGWTIFLCMLGTAVFGLAGDIGLFQAQRGVEPSRIASLQSLKVPIVALISCFAFSKSYSPLQLLGIALVLCSSAALSHAGSRIGWKAWAWLVFNTAGYAGSDVCIAIALTRAAKFCDGVWAASALVVGISGVALAVFALPLALLQWRFARASFPTGGECLRYAVPFALLWFVAMIFLLACFALSDVVMGTIAQSARGVMSVAIGWLLAKRGFSDVEGPVSASVFVRRAVAAALIVLAMALYAS